jgi:hypothetical protein
VEEDLRVRAREVAAQEQRQPDEHRSQHDGCDRVQRPEPEPDDDGERHHCDRVEDDLARGLALAPHHGQHWHPGCGVRVLDHQRQRPEVRRRPEEHDEEEPKSRQRQRSGRRRIADERRDGAGGASDDDVLRRRALEPAGVDEDIEEVADEREDRGQHVHGGPEERERESREEDSELEGLLRRHPTGRDRTSFGTASHERVDVAVEHVVERRRPATGQGEPEHRHDEEPEWRYALRADEHARGARQQEQRHDPRLRQREVVACGGERGGLAPAGPRQADERYAEGDGRGADVKCNRPGRVAAPRDEAAESDRGEQRDERGGRESLRRRVRDPGQEEVPDEQRQREERDAPVRGPELERGAHDDEPDRDRAHERGQPEEDARSDALAARQARARHARHAASVAGRRQASRW